MRPWFVGVVIAVAVIAVGYPSLSTLWGLDAKLDAQAKAQHEIMLGIARIERKLDEEREGLGK